MAATKRQFNWTAVGFTPAGGSSTPLTGITNIDVDAGGSVAKFSGDADRGPSTMINDYNEPVMSLTSGDEASLLALTPGVIGALTATHNDAKGATGGAIIYTLNPCIVETATGGGAHREFGKGTVNFRGIFADGVTNPLAFTRA